MKATLETTPENQLRMCDLEPGDIAEILPNTFSGTHGGSLICIAHNGDAIKIGGDGDMWSSYRNVDLSVRRLTPGEKIVIS